MKTFSWICSGKSTTCNTWNNRVEYFMFKIIHNKPLQRVQILNSSHAESAKITPNRFQVVSACRMMAIPVPRLADIIWLFCLQTCNDPLHGCSVILRLVKEHDFWDKHFPGEILSWKSDHQTNKTTWEEKAKGSGTNRTIDDMITHHWTNRSRGHWTQTGLFTWLRASVTGQDKAFQVLRGFVTLTVGVSPSVNT